MAAAKKAGKGGAPKEEPIDIEDTSADVDMDPRLIVSVTTLERTPERVTKFLAGAASSRQARALMGRRGWTSLVMQEGRSLLMDVLAPAPSAAELKLEKLGAEGDRRVAEAENTLNALDEGHFGIAKTALLHNFPDQYDFVFHELSATDDGPKAVVGWRTFLTRLNELRSGEKRKDTRAKDHAALALLAERGLNEAELSRIEKLVRVAEGSEAEFTAPDDEGNDIRLARLKKLWAWYAQWASVARVEVKSRSLRIRLGLAKRRRAASAIEEPDDEEGTEPTG
jgi:hypothetical protein